MAFHLTIVRTQKSNLVRIKTSIAIYVDARTKRQYTWTEIKTAGLDFGAGHRNIWDWKRGEVIGLFSPNCIDPPAIIFGTLWAGGIVSPANPGYTAEELPFQPKNSGAKALVTQLACLDVGQGAASIERIPESRIILIGDSKEFSLANSATFPIFTAF